MKREIKFRAYHKKDNDWLRDHNGEILIFGPINALTNVVDPRDLVIQQYIGVKDKNGEELFEGDLVSYKWEAYEHEVEESVGQIYFEDGVFYFGKPDEFATNDCNFLAHTLERFAIGIILT